MTETKKIRILNLYAGIGGNRKLWSGDIEVTAVENVPEIAKIYSDFFPQDKVIVTDAHQYLLEHYKEFDFIWSSPPCPSHSRLRKGFSCNVGAKAIYPDMRLYEEIIFLEGYFEGKWVVENVISWYNPLIRPYELERHYFWSNFVIPDNNMQRGKVNLTGGYHETEEEQVDKLIKEYGFDIKNLNGNRRLLLRNCVHPKLGLHIFELAFKTKQTQLSSIPPTTKVVGILEATL
jgi:DNA (cytosine-5)-methyltransferase 1